jgi:hypothetical protein
MRRQEDDQHGLGELDQRLLGPAEEGVGPGGLEHRCQDPEMQRQEEGEADA